MLREVIATHSAKLDRVAAAAKTAPYFDAGEAARMDLRVGWAYRLLDAQGAGRSRVSVRSPSLVQ